MRVERIGDAAGRPVRIYALCEHPSWRPRYVGKTSHYIHERHKSHIRAARQGQLPVHRWIRKQIKGGNWLAIRLLEIVPEGVDWAARERHWIKHFRSAGAGLLNLTDGGEGLAGYQFSAEHVSKIAAALRKGRLHACEQCGITFYRKPKDALGPRVFCSRQCYASWQHGRSRPMNSSTTSAGQRAAAAAKRARRECRHGHTLEGDNLYINKRGARICRECSRQAKRRYRARGGRG